MKFYIIEKFAKEKEIPVALNQFFSNERSFCFNLKNTENKEHKEWLHLTQAGTLSSLMVFPKQTQTLQ